MGWERELVALLAGFLIALVTVPVGVSGAVFLLPVQLDLLMVPSPQVTPTNLLYNVVSLPGALLRNGRPGWLVGPLLLGAVPGVALGAVLRVEVVPGERPFRLVAAAVLFVMGLVVLVSPPRRSPARLGPAVLVPAGFVAGTVGGVYGIGGGSLLGPFLVGAGLSVAAVAPAALAVTFLTSVAGALSYAVLALLGPGPIAPDWSLGLAAGVGGLLGGQVGVGLAPRLPERLLRRLLGSLALALAVLYAVQGLR